MKIIFLDIDGVLTSVRTGWFNLDIYAVNFLRWCCAESGAKIVISSTWRYNHGKEFWETIFGEHLHEDFKTPDLVKQRSSGIYLAETRGSEIQAWLDKNETDFYVILDDDADMLDAQKPFLIQTDSMNGMLDSHMAQLRATLLIEKYPERDEELYQHENMFASKNTVRENGEKIKPHFV